MAIETMEQGIQVSEELISTGENKEPSETSEETEPVSEKQTEEKIISFKTQEELDNFIKEKVTPIAQGMKDRELKTVYDELNKLKKERGLFEEKLLEKEEDTKLSKLEKSELTEYGETTEVKDFQEARREIIDRGRKLRLKEKQIAEREEQTTTNARDQNAFVRALKLFLVEEDAKNLFSVVEPLAKKMAGAKTEEEAELIYQLEELKLQMKAEPKTRKPKPDSSLPSASGGATVIARDWLKMATTKELKARIAEIDKAHKEGKIK